MREAHLCFIMISHSPSLHLNAVDRSPIRRKAEEKKRARTGSRIKTLHCLTMHACMHPQLSLYFRHRDLDIYIYRWMCARVFVSVPPPRFIATQARRFFLQRRHTYLLEIIRVHLHAYIHICVGIFICTCDVHVVLCSVPSLRCSRWFHTSIVLACLGSLRSHQGFIILISYLLRPLAISSIPSSSCSSLCSFSLRSFESEVLLFLPCLFFFPRKSVSARRYSSCRIFSFLRGGSFRYAVLIILVLLLIILVTLLRI